MESELAVFYTRHLRPKIGGTHHDLVAGLVGRPTDPRDPELRLVPSNGRGLGPAEPPSMQGFRVRVIASAPSGPRGLSAHLESASAHRPLELATSMRACGRSRSRS